MMPHRTVHEKNRKQRGFGLPELLIVVFSVSIIGMIALPRIFSSRRQTQFTEMQKQIALSLNEVRRESKSQKTPITYRYDDINKLIVIYNGNFGALGDARNSVIDIADFGFEKSDIIYGRPDWLPEIPLADTSNLTQLTENSVEITFQTDGAIVGEANDPQNKALFFYHRRDGHNAVFAVSIPGKAGSARVWEYSSNIKDYVEKK